MPTTKDFDYLEIEGLGTFKPAGSGGGGEAPVQSVNGKTGTVVLGAEDVGALPADTDIPAEVTEQTVTETEARSLFVNTEIELEMTPEMAAEMTHSKEEGENDG